MFELYTESARRVLFFARYEASQLGTTTIETEHLLLGLIREPKGTVARILALSHVSLESLRREIEGRSVFREKIATSVEIPFAPETKSVLQFAAEEADRLRHSYIGTEHLLLGLLRVDHSVAGEILGKRGLRADDVRKSIVELCAEDPAESKSSVRIARSEQIEHIKQLVEQLAAMAPDGSESQALADHIHARLDELRWQ
jgi:ATP-dependent Clp protease ATP-binding subunit ClpC